MYSLAQREDMRVLDEPLYAHFLKHTGAERPCREATLATRPSNPNDALAFMAPTRRKSGARTNICSASTSPTTRSAFPGPPFAITGTSFCFATLRP